MPNILEVQNLVKNYGDFTAVKGITFDIQEGEIFSLLGPNGAGKTTTISMLSTLYTPTSGDAFIGGHSVTKDAMGVRNIMLAGLVVFLIGAGAFLAARFNLPLRRLPGDMRIEGETGAFYFPLASLILVSVVLTMVWNVAFRWIKNSGKQVLG